MGVTVVIITWSRRGDVKLSPLSHSAPPFVCFANSVSVYRASRLLIPRRIFHSSTLESRSGQVTFTLLGTVFLITSIDK